MSGKQRNLFTDAPWEIDDAAEKLVASIVFPGPLDREYDYLVPDGLRSEVALGRRVKVPLGRGNRFTEGYCVRLETREVEERKLKFIHQVIDHRNLLSPSMLRLTEWISERYLCGWGNVLEAVLPAGVRVQAGTRMTKYLSVPDGVRAKLKELKLPPKQSKVLRILSEADEAMTANDLAHAASCTHSPIKGLIDKGYILAQQKRTAPSNVKYDPIQKINNFDLNSEQQAALGEITHTLNAGKHETFLLHGITGSGKTEIYIQAIQEVVSFGRQAIVLVPEISLTPQTVERFRQRFDQVAVLHSHLTNAERHWHWERISSGKVSVVVGARSAIFAPTPHLGLIVMDEEHETSFKQESAPRYHTREVALQRAKMENIPLVLGSATPCLESWHRAEQGEYRLIQLSNRIHNRPLPAVSTIDLRNQDKREASRGVLSRQLCLQMEQVFRDKSQVILLLNRRGYSTHIQCPSCGTVVKCDHCDIALTYHRQDNLLLCHYCDAQQRPPTKCATCSSGSIRYSGQGTQRLEAEVKKKFPNQVSLRMDTDTMQAPGAHQKALERFRSGEVNILLGTQMIAKGLDFPNVTLVGVVNADLALHLPDFRASERTFQLLAQVAGRAGRGEKGGRVLVQTFTPDHPTIEAATRHAYEEFAAQELPLREALGYPPFGVLFRIVIRGTKEQLTSDFCMYMAEELRKAIEQVIPRSRVLGPAPAPISKLRDKFRFNIQIQGYDEVLLRNVIQQTVKPLKPPIDIEWIVDVDPLSML